MSIVKKPSRQPNDWGSDGWGAKKRKPHEEEWNPAASWRYRRAMKKKNKKRLEEIERIAQQYNVPNWMAILYFDNKSITDDFLSSRKNRIQEGFKNERSQHLGGAANNETTTDLTWKELYEVLGEEEIREIHLWRILEVIKNIVKNIQSSVIQKKLVSEFEVEVFTITEEGDAKQKIRELEKSIFPRITNSVTRYLSTELPNGYTIYLEPFTKTESIYTGCERYNTGGSGGPGGYTIEKYDMKITVYLKVKLSYS